MISTRTLGLIALGAAVLFAAVLAFTLLMWHTPPLHPVPLTS